MKGMERKKRVKKFGRNETVILTIMCMIPAVFVFLFNYLPLFGFVLAFKDFRFDLGIFGSEWIGLDNFKFLFEAGDFGYIIINTVVMNLIMILLGVVTGVAVAIMMYNVRKRHLLKAYQTALLLPYFISWVIVSYIVYTLLNPAYGVFNNLLETFGGKPIDWYSEPAYWRVILPLASIWKGVGYGSLVYYAALVGIDTTYYEAARIDGANRRQLVHHVTIPFLIPVITIQLLLAIGGIMRADFGLFYQVPRDVGQLKSVTNVMDVYIYKCLKEGINMDRSVAAGMIQSVVGCVLVLICNKLVYKIEPDNALI